MAPKLPLVVFCLIDNPECPLRMLMHEVVKHNGSDDASSTGLENGASNIDNHIASILAMVDSIAGRILHVQLCNEDSKAEIWLRVSGKPRLVDAFEKAMKRSVGVSFQKIFSNKFNTIYRIVFDSSKCPCTRGKSFCPFKDAIGGVMVKSVVVSPYGLLCEYIVAKPKALTMIRERGCKILVAHSIEEYDYMLTEKQELAMIYAYMMGYYSFPRKISLKELADKLGLSVSTLAELLRRAEAKVMEAYIRHELPHYFVGVLLSKAYYGDKIKSVFNSRERREVKPAPKISG